MSDSSDQNQSSSIKKTNVKKSEALWMMTFSDLSFILMCFFALLLSMSTLNTQKYDNVVDGFDSGKTKKTRNLSKIYKLVKKEIRKRKLQKQVGVKLDAEGLAVEFKSGMLFKSGSSSIGPQFLKTAGQIVKIIAKAPRKYHLSVEGHTDDTGSPAANWQLSAKRGISMLDMIKSRGVRMKKMKVIAYAATQPKIGIKGKKGPALRKARAANRRVVIRLN